MDLSNYIGQIASLKEEFLTLMPLTSDVGAQQTQVDKFFMVLTLIGLRPDLETLRDQILGSPSVPSLDDVFARLLRISSTQTLPSDSPLDSSVLVSHTNLRGGRSGTRGRGQRPHCTYCNKLGHTRDRCYQLHGRPPGTAHVAQSSDSDSQPPQTQSSCTSQGVPPFDSEYDAFLRYQAAKSASVASVAQTGNVSSCLTHTSSLGPWILDSGASDHVSGNKDIFSFLTTTPTLPTVTLANGSQTVAKNIGLAHPLPSLPLTSVIRGQLIVRIVILLRTTRTLLLHYHVPFRFLGDAVLTACYLINRMPSSVLHAQIPHSLLFPDQPLYFLPPRVFGCTCFVHVLTPGQDKLSAKATKCIFLSYSRLQKGYRCYSPQTHRYFLSADVTFFEDSPFFFSSSESLPVTEVLPLPIISSPRFDDLSSRPL